MSVWESVRQTRVNGLIVNLEYPKIHVICTVSIHTRDSCRPPTDSTGITHLRLSQHQDIRVLRLDVVLKSLCERVASN